jgi:NAD(P)-dependent dehydrogenase (short-subunit alcohol dehydrogenase family)
MHDLSKNKALVTGAASGIGLALTKRLLAEGATVVMADIEAPVLEAAAAELRPLGTVWPAELDVTDAAAVESLAAEHPDVTLLFPNAGVTASGAVWESTPQDWEWMWRVNVMGVAHCVRAFVPRMIASGRPGHVCITSSLAGYLNQPGFGAYNASKHAAASIAETLASDLHEAGHPIGVSVIAPWFVTTRLAQAARNRPAELGASSPPSDFMQLVWAKLGRMRDVAQTADDVASQVTDAITRDQFAIFPYEPSKDGVRLRFETLLAGGAAGIYLPE